MNDYFQINQDIDLLFLSMEDPSIEFTSEYISMMERLDAYYNLDDDQIVEANEAFGTSWIGAAIRKAAYSIKRIATFNYLGTGSEKELFENLGLAEKALVTKAANLNTKKFLSTDTKLPPARDLSRIISQLTTITGAYKKLYTSEIWAASKDVVTPAMKTIVQVAQANHITPKKDLTKVHSFSVAGLYSVWDNKFCKTATEAEKLGYTDKNTYGVLQQSFKAFIQMLKTYGPQKINNADLYAAVSKFNSGYLKREFKEPMVVWQRVCTTYQLGAVHHFMVASLYVSFLKSIGTLTGEHFIVGNPDVVVSSSANGHA